MASNAPDVSALRRLVAPEATGDKRDRGLVALRELPGLLDAFEAVRALMDDLRQPNGVHTYISGIHASNCGACWLLHRLHTALGDVRPCPACKVATLEAWNARQARVFCHCCPDCEKFL